MRWSVDACAGRTPEAAGIDTLLHWATSRSGLRPCDTQLRARYPAVRNSIMSPNSLYGAMPVGGMALALRLRQQWPQIELNETHPKVLFYALRGHSYVPADAASVAEAIGWTIDRGRCIEARVEGEHALDAALSALVTREGVAEGWRDIIGPREALLFPSGPVRYLWPEALD